MRDRTKTVVVEVVSDEKCHLIDVKAVKISEGVLAPFFCCAKCKTLYSSYKLINGKWVNQSGYGVAIQHSMKCGSGSSTNI